MDTKIYRAVFYLGFAAFAVQLVWSVQFCKERIIFLDTACLLFELLKNNTFAIEHHRYTDAFTQVLPLTAAHLGKGIDTIILLYSMSFVLFHLVFYTLTGLVFKRYDLAIAILICNLLFVTDTFYYTPSSLPQGISFVLFYAAFLGWAHLHYGATLFRGLSLVVSVLLPLVIIIFFHPMMVFVFAYLLLFFLGRQNILIRWQQVGLLLGSYVGLSVLKSLLLHSDYERRSLSGLRNFATKFPDYFTLFSNRQFLYHCTVIFIWIPIALVAVIAYYIHAKQFRKLYILVAFFIAYFFLVNISYPDASTPQFYIENLYLPLAFFLALPLVFDVLPALKHPLAILVVVAVFMGSSLWRIYGRHVGYAERLGLLRSTLQCYGKQKTVLNVRNYPLPVLKMEWGTPYEFWLLSTSESGYAASIIVDQHPEKLLWLKSEKHSIYVNWNLYDYSEFHHSTYFKFPDTTSVYRVQGVDF